MSKIVSLCGICAVSVLLCLSLYTNKVGVVTNASVENNLFTVVIDAGHGGIDGGVCVDGVKESQINLEIANDLKELFLGGGFNVVMTRTCDVGLYGDLKSGFKRRDLLARVNIAKDNDADIFISIHQNQFRDSSCNGSQVFYKVDSKESKNLAECVQKELYNVRDDSRKLSVKEGDYYILNNECCPSIIVECGFMTNKQELALLLTEEYRRKIAYSIYTGGVNFLASSK